jgi:hypothetical protein
MQAQLPPLHLAACMLLVARMLSGTFRVSKAMRAATLKGAGF